MENWKLDDMYYVYYSKDFGIIKLFSITNQNKELFSTQYCPVPYSFIWGIIISKESAMKCRKKDLQHG